MELPIIDNQRREFFSQILTGLGGIACGGVLASLSACEPFTTKVETGGKALFDTIKDDPMGMCNTVGNALVLNLKDTNGNVFNNGYKIVILRRGTATVPEYVVVSSKCNHQDCEVVAPAAPGENLVCPCHLSEFSSTDGTLLVGPATASLVRFNSSFDSTTKILTIFS